ncbi:unnamed protein product [Ectocarpus sp. 12 AP-2014]
MELTTARGHGRDRLRGPPHVWKHVNLSTCDEVCHINLHYHLHLTTAPARLGHLLLPSPPALVGPQQGMKKYTKHKIYHVRAIYKAAAHRTRAAKTQKKARQKSCR